MGDAGGGTLRATAGVATRRAFAQLTGGVWRASFTPGAIVFGSTGDPRVETTSVGLEVGPVWRVSRIVELRFGAGAHWMWGTAQQTYRSSAGASTQVASFPFSRAVPSAMAAAHLTGFALGRLRGRIGVELRQHFAASQHFADLGRDVAIAGSFAGVNVGFELPWGGAEVVR
jgi:hypothetical protein